MHGVTSGRRGVRPPFTVSPGRRHHSGSARRLLLGLCVLSAAGSAEAAAAAPPPARPANTVLSTRVAAYAADRGTVSIAVGRSAGVAVGDRFWVFSESGVAGAGEIQVVADEGAAGAVDATTGGIEPGRSVTVLRAGGLAEYREGLPPEVTLRGTLTRVPPGRRTAWMSLGSRSGLRAGDTVLVRRLTDAQVEMPLARGRVELLREDTALVVLRPIVSNALPQPGDIAELWPSPADRQLGRVESTVLRVQPTAGPEGSTMITLVGSAEEGLAEGRLVDLFRGHDYVGHATLVAVGDPLSTARVFDAGQKEPPREGDRAWVRPPADPPRALAAAIFQIVSTDGDYAQMAAGETDGVRTGEKFLVRHQDPADPTIKREIAELTVNAVNVDHATAIVRLLTPEGEKVRLWDFAERREPRLPDWRQVGIVEQVMPDSRSASASLEGRSKAEVGRIVRCVPESPAAGQPAKRAAAAIVIFRAADQAILFVPPGWGDAEDLTNARVELADAPAGAGPR